MNLKRTGTITIEYSVKDDSIVVEKDLVFWLFKVLRQFGIIATIETTNDSYEEEETELL